MSLSSSALLPADSSMVPGLSSGRRQVLGFTSSPGLHSGDTGVSALLLVLEILQLVLALHMRGTLPWMSIAHGLMPSVLKAVVHGFAEVFS